MVAFSLSIPSMCLKPRDSRAFVLSALIDGGFSKSRDCSSESYRASTCLKPRDSRAFVSRTLSALIDVGISKSCDCSSESTVTSSFRQLWPLPLTGHVANGC